MPKKYERVAGRMTRDETYSKLNECLIECEELAAMMAHLHAAEDDVSPRAQLLATGWRGISQMMHLVRDQVIKLATGKLLKQ